MGLGLAPKPFSFTVFLLMPNVYGMVVTHLWKEWIHLGDTFLSVVSTKNTPSLYNNLKTFRPYIKINTLGICEQ